MRERLRTMARRDWWIGIGIVAIAIIVHAFVPRFELRSRDGMPLVRVDRWTGRVEAMPVDPQPLPPEALSEPSSVDGTADLAANAPPGAAAKTDTFRRAEIDQQAGSREADASPLAGVAVKPARSFVATDPTAGTPASAGMSVVPAVGGEARPALLGAAAVACTIDQSVRQRSGTEAGRRYRKGLGRLRIKNGMASNTVAVLLNDADGAPRRAMFIRAREVGVFTSVPSGRYRLRFQRSSDAARHQSGAGWLREGRICQRSGTSEFDEPFDFFEIESDLNTQYVSYELTLHPAATGTARTHTSTDSADGQD
jgi:hypothetical protein